MKSIIERFYKAFEALDPEAMAACYHKDIRFEDPAFGNLKGEHAGNMWRMLCNSQKGKDFVVEASNFSYKNGIGRANWEAHYDFSQTGRRVHNIVEAEMLFKDGKIIRHVDDFHLYRWSRQALGLTGTLIGWTPFFKKKLNQQTNQLLRKFEEKINA